MASGPAKTGTAEGEADVSKGKKQQKLTVATLAGLSLDSRVGNNRISPRSPRNAGDGKSPRSLHKSQEEAKKEVENEEGDEDSNDDDDDDDEDDEDSKEVEAASRIFYKAKSVAQLLGTTPPTSDPQSSSGSESEGAKAELQAKVTVAVVSDGAATAGLLTPSAPAVVDPREARLRELLKRRQEMTRLEAHLKSLEESLVSERSELRQLEGQLPASAAPAADRLTTLIAAKSSNALLQLRDEALAAKAQKERRKERKVKKEENNKKNTNSGALPAVTDLLSSDSVEIEPTVEKATGTKNNKSKEEKRKEKQSNGTRA